MYAPTLGKIRLPKIKVFRAVTGLVARSGIPGLSTAASIANRVRGRSPRQAVMEAAAAGEIDPVVAQQVSDAASAVSRGAAQAGIVASSARAAQEGRNVVALTPRVTAGISPTVVLAAGAGLVGLLLLSRRK